MAQHKRVKAVLANKKIPEMSPGMAEFMEMTDSAAEWVKERYPYIYKVITTTTPPEQSLPCIDNDLET